MKCLSAKIGIILLMIPIIAKAAWQVVAPQNTIPSQPFFQAGLHQDRVMPPIPVQGHIPFSPKKFACGNAVFPGEFKGLGRPAGCYAISVSGSLKENVERIMDRYHWHVVWHAPYDYNFDGRITGSSLPNVIEKLFSPFPLQAVLYMSNRTLLVVPRNIR